jgi:PKHD-type hydroxylase
MGVLHRPNAFPPGYIEEVSAVASKLEGKRGAVGYPYTERVDRSQRSVTARKIDRDYAPELVDVFSHVFYTANATVWNFDIEPKLPLMMFLEYSAAHGDVFHWHYDEDLSHNSQRPRKLTATAMLSNPGKDFEGGQFEVRTMPVAEPMVANLARGDVLMFPSHMLHRVTPVTSGVRHVLVAWAHGPKWR